MKLCLNRKSPTAATKSTHDVYFHQFHKDRWPAQPAGWQRDLSCARRSRASVIKQVPPYRSAICCKTTQDPFESYFTSPSPRNILPYLTLTFFLPRHAIISAREVEGKFYPLSSSFCCGSSCHISLVFVSVKCDLLGSYIKGAWGAHIFFWLPLEKIWTTSHTCFLFPVELKSDGGSFVSMGKMCTVDYRSKWKRKSHGRFLFLLRSTICKSYYFCRGHFIKIMDNEGAQ